jgi:hypothetical protein
LTVIHKRMCFNFCIGTYNGNVPHRNTSLVYCCLEHSLTAGVGERLCGWVVGDLCFQDGVKDLVRENCVVVVVVVVRSCFFLDAESL